MRNAALMVVMAVLWGWLLQWIATRRGGASTTRAYPALVQQPYLALWLIGVVVLVLVVGRLP